MWAPSGLAPSSKSRSRTSQLEPELMPAGVMALHAPSREKVMLTSAWRSSLEEETWYAVPCQLPASHAGWVPSAFSSAGLMRSAHAASDRQRARTAIRRVRRMVTRSPLSFVEGKDPPPVVLHADDDPSLRGRPVVQRLGKGAHPGGGQPPRGAVRVLALDVVVQQQHREARAVPGFRVLEHLLIADRVAEGRARTAADHQMDALGFARLVVVQKQPRLLRQEWLAVLDIAVHRPAGAPDHLLGRNAVHLFCVDPHEVLTSAGDDVGSITAGAQILQHFLHWQIAELGVGPLEARVLRRLEPRPDLNLELVDRHAGQRRGEELLEVIHRQHRVRLAVARQNGLEWLHLRQLRLRLDHRRNTFQAIQDLRVHRMLDPQRAVLVERGDALGRRHEPRAALRRRALHELDDRLLGRPVVPRRERIGLRANRRAHEPQRADDQDERRAGSHHLAMAALAASILAFTASRLKLAPFCIGGYSTAVMASFVTSSCTNTKRQNSYLNHSKYACEPVLVPLSGQPVRSNGSRRRLVIWGTSSLVFSPSQPAG